MTREEAIQELQNCKGLIQQDGQDYLDERDIPLLDMAIEALREISILAKPSNKVEVVRCRDCRWFGKGENEVDSWEYCTRLGHHPQSDGYCAWGDKREIKQTTYKSLWIETMGGNQWNECINLECPICSGKFKRIDFPSDYNFCPKCGNRMRSDDDGNRD